MTNNNLDVRASTTGQIYPKEKANQTQSKKKLYSFYVNHVIGLQHILVSLCYLQKKGPICLEIELSSFPILPNESFIFNYSQKRGVELEFSPIK